MRARFLGKDPDSQVDNSPTLFATDRTDRSTFIAQGWKVTDPQAWRTSALSPTMRRSSRYPRMCSSSTFAHTRRRPSADQLIEPSASALPACSSRLRVHGLPPGGPRPLRPAIQGESLR